MNQIQIYIAMAVLVVLVIVAIIIGLVNSSKINALLDYSEDGDLVENLDKYYNNIRDLQKKTQNESSGSYVRQDSGM